MLAHNLEETAEYDHTPLTLLFERCDTNMGPLQQSIEEQPYCGRQNAKELLWVDGELEGVRVLRRNDKWVVLAVDSAAGTEAASLKPQCAHEHVLIENAIAWEDCWIDRACHGDEVLWAAELADKVSSYSHEKRCWSVVALECAIKKRIEDA